ncbi:FRG domain-containing protein [Pedobacter sp. UYP1]|uniref:FRG domain-containing protein n=1 Tax=Pedobacter sp. UYP1 TaxID=1756396 RepID=UPI003399D995
MNATSTDSVTGFRNLRELYLGLRECEACPPLANGMPRFLFRAERDGYPNTFTSMDRHYHDQNLSLDAFDELEDITAFVMQQPFPDKKLIGREAGAFAQHYGLPTQIFDFTSSAKIAMFFAANLAKHTPPALGGNMAILNVERALDAGCTIDDLRHHSYAKRSCMQSAYGMLYMGFNSEGFYCLKDPEIISKIGLAWCPFVHLENDVAFLNEIGVNMNILSTEGDPFTGLAQEFIDEFVVSRGHLSQEAARILSINVPAVGRSQEENFKRWASA